MVLEALRTAERGLERTLAGMGVLLLRDPGRTRKGTGMEIGSNSRIETISFLGTHYQALCTHVCNQLTGNINWDSPFIHIFIHPTNMC